MLAVQAVMIALSVTRETDSSRATRSVPAGSWRQQIRHTHARAVMPAVHHPTRGPWAGSRATAVRMPATAPTATQTRARGTDRIRPFIDAPRKNVAGPSCLRGADAGKVQSSRPSSVRSGGDARKGSELLRLPGLAGCSAGGAVAYNKCRCDRGAVYLPPLHCPDKHFHAHERQGGEILAHSGQGRQEVV